MGKPTLKFIHRDATLDVNDQNRYWLHTDFVPPPTALTPIFASGLNLNRFEGATQVDAYAVNRAFAFGLDLKGDSALEIDAAARDLVGMLQFAGDVRDPLYLEYNSDNDQPLPLWGQLGANLRYEVAAAERPQFSSEFMRGINRASNVEAQLNLTLKPYADGQDQELTSAVGGILEDTWGSPLRKSRGLRIPPATVNMIANPIFGHPTDWDYGWTPGSAMQVEQCVDVRFRLFDSPSVQLTGGTNVAANNVWTTSVTTVTGEKYTVHALIKKPDGSLPTYNEVKIIVDGTQFNPTFIALGDGWYIAERANVASGTTGATTMGVMCFKNSTVHVAGVQCEHAEFRTPLCHGDMFGCVWAGTAHETATTRTAARIRLPISRTTLLASRGSLRLIWKTDYANTHAANMTLFTASGLSAYFNATDDKFYLVDGTNTISSAAQTFAAGDVLDLLFTWGAGGLVIYKNGVSIANGAYDIANLGTYLYIGTTATPTLHAGGRFIAGATFDVEWTSTQAAAAYTKVSPLFVDEDRLECLPWLWTKDGDNAIDNCDDGATYNNWALCGGIPGSAHAKTIIRFTPSNLSGGAYWLGLHNHPEDRFVYPAHQYFGDFSGAAVANSCGGEATDTSVTADPSFTTISPDFIQGEVHLFTRIILKTTTGAAQIQAGVGHSANLAEYFTDEKLIATPAAYRMFYLGSLFVSSPENILFENRTRYYFYLTGGAAFYVDFLMAFPGDVVKIPVPVQTYASITLDGAFVYAVDSNSVFVANEPKIGDVLELMPDRLNYLWAITSDDNVAWVITDTILFNAVHVTPRYELL